MTNFPEFHDSKNRLLFKWCQSLSQRHGGAFAPQIADTDNNLLRKILSLFRL